MSLINTKLLLRLLNTQEFFAHQWLMSYPNDHKILSELVNIRTKQFSIINVPCQSNQSDQTTGGTGGGRGTIKGLRAKNDPNVNPVIRNRKLTR
jgi:hypothetical protein